MDLKQDAGPAAQRRHDIVIAGVVFALIAVVLLAFFRLAGPTVGHSFYLDYHWSLGFTEQFHAGELYPRWLFAVNAGAGSPVFYYYGPLPFWIQALAEPLLCRGCDGLHAMMTGPVVMLAVSGMGFYLWIREYVRRAPALFSAVAYLFLPYHFLIDLWHRQAFAEFAAYAFMPLVLFGLERAERSPRYLCLAGAAYAGLLYAHLPSALLFSPLIVCFVALRHRPSRWLPYIVAPVILGIGLAAMYLVPALTTQDTINAAAWWNREDGHFVALNWLWLDGREAPDPGFAANVLVALLIPSLLSLAVWISLVWRRGDRRAIVLFPMLSLAYAWFLMTAPSAPIWSHVELLSKVQFPWRLGIVVDLCSMTILALWLQQATAERRRSLPALLLVAVALASPYCVNPRAMYQYLWATKSDAETDYITRRLAHGDGAPEYRTAWSMASSGGLSRHDLNDALAAVPQVRIVAGPGTLSGIRQESNRLWADVAATAPVRVRFRRFFYPGWRLISLPGGEAIAVAPSEEFGLLEAELPAGSHHLLLERGATDEEHSGTIISAATLVLCVLLFAGTRAPRRGRRAAQAGGRSAWT